MNFKSDLEKHAIFGIVGTCADESNIEAFVVGGFVRDLILKRKSKDIDFVCTGSGIELAQNVALSLGNLNVTVFKNFGTARIDFEGLELEFVGARKESYTRGSRKPIVEDGTLEDDQNRRDFTINTMAVSLKHDSFGKLVDPFDAVNDLKRKIIKTPLDPNVTFSDDPLRIMRAIRFASQLNFDIDADTFDAIISNVDRLTIISQERIIDELNKIVLTEKPSYGFKLLFHTGILQAIFPEFVALHGVETINGKSHKDNFYHTLQVLDNICETTNDLWVRWAAILHDIAKPPTKRFDNRVGWTFHGHEDKGARMVTGIFRRMKLPMNEKMKKVQKLVKLHLRPIALVKETVTDSAIRRLLFEAGEDIDDLMKLCKADITSKNDNRVKRYLTNFELVEKKMQKVEVEDKMRNFKLAISGDDIMKHYSLKPNKMVGEIKEEIREAVLNGKIKNTFEAGFELMKEIGKTRGLNK